MHQTGVEFSKLSEPKRTIRIYERALRTRSRGQDELRDDTVLRTNLVKSLATKSKFDLYLIDFHRHFSITNG
jgi:hypothetical protein